MELSLDIGKWENYGKAREGWEREEITKK